MPAHIQSGTLQGISFTPVDVEIDIQNGLPRFAIVGLPDASLQEARDRVTSAIKNSGYSFPRTHVVANLAPAHVKKIGSGFDLPIALGVLAADQGIPPAALEQTLFFGELGLDGTLRPVHGMLPLLLGARKYGAKTIIIPQQHRAEAQLCPDVTILCAGHLCEVVQHLRGIVQLSAAIPLTPLIERSPPVMVDFASISGQEQAKRALEVSAAGGHNILLYGPPGSGKTMLSQALAGILPPLTPEEHLELSQIRSISGQSLTLSRERPFRSPHHTSSPIALLGGGALLKPGEITQAHRGVLFLDEFPEFSREALEGLRQPLENGSITLSRARGTVQYPSRFQLVAAMNPCPCGYAGESDERCTCLGSQKIAYMRRLSGPLLDRIDMHLHVPRIPPHELRLQTLHESSEIIRERVLAARTLQTQRYAPLGIASNHELTSSLLRIHAALTPELEALFCDALQRMQLSARAADKVLKVARTIADLAHHTHIQQEDLLEALQYRVRFT